MLDPARPHGLSLAPVLLGSLLFVSSMAFAQDEEQHRTGFVEPTLEEQAWMDRHMLKVECVKLNDLGLERVEKHQKKKGKKSSGKKAVERGDELEGTVGVAAPETSAESSSEITSTDATPVVFADALDDGSLPSAVDNSDLDYFPPVSSQGGIGSCAQFSSVYYTMTHMTAMARGWNAKTGGSAYHFSPSFTYNMISKGTDTGSSFQWELLINNGCARSSMFPYTQDYKVWPTAGDIWLDALDYRAESSWSISGLDAEDDATYSNALEQVKAILNNGYIANYSTRISSWQWDTLDNNPSTATDDNLVGEDVAHCVDGDAGPHAMTVVGYNDDLWCDVNGNGEVDAGETGALKICNSWGTYWKNAGFAWVLYDALRTVSDVPDAPARTRPVFYAGKIQGIIARSEYAPRVVARVTMNHRYREQINVTLGVTADSSDQKAGNSCLTYDGGPYAFDGTTTAVDGTFYFDLSDVAPADLTYPAQYYMDLTDSTATNSEALTVSEVVIVDLINDAEQASTEVPVSLDNATTRFLVTYPVDTEPPSPNPLTWASAPGAFDTTAITMQAINASDASGPVEYYFENTTNGANSGWTTSALWQDSGLTTGQSYGYRVRARDAEGNLGDWSAEATAFPAADNTAPTPSPMTWSTPPATRSSGTITMTATAANDPAGVEYYFKNLSFPDGSHDSDWQDSPIYIDAGLTPETAYTYTVAARDTSSNRNETFASAEGSATTLVAHYFDAFDNDGLGGNTNAGGGLVLYNNLRGFIWDDDGNLDSSGNNSGNRYGTVYTDNSFDVSGGFTLDVVYNIDKIVSEGLAYKASFGLIADPTGIGNNHFISGTDQTSIGVSLTDNGGVQGLNEINPTTGYTNLVDASAQPVTTGDRRTFSLTVAADGRFSYSLDGQTPTVGTTAFDLAQEYHFAVYEQYMTGLEIQSVSLGPVKSAPTIGDVGMVMGAGSAMTFSWQGESGATYGLEVTDNLVTGRWETVTNVTGAAELISLTAAMDRTNAFFRVYLTE
jgi:C1A family cysteine protease/chitodextrinase